VDVERAEKAVQGERVGPGELGKPSPAGHPHHLHLPQPVGRRGESRAEEKVVFVGRFHERDAQRVATDDDIAPRSPEGDDAVCEIGSFKI